MANSTQASPPSDSRWMRSMFAPCAARMPETTCKSSGPSVRAISVSAYRWARSSPAASGLRKSSESPSSRATKRSSLSRAASSAVSTAKPSVKRPWTTTCSTSERRAFDCVSTREIRAVIPGASRPVKVRISSPNAVSLFHRRRAGAALSRRKRNRLQAFRAALRRGRRRRLLQEGLGEEEDDERNDEKVEDAADQVAVLDRVLPGKDELRVAPFAARQHQADDGHQHVLD